ncbi:MAG: hypothetical protein ABIS01_13610, partial [Ferruginibacter sp.]
YAIKTAVWTFTINKEIEPIITPSNESYFLVENNLKDVYVIANKRLHLKYSSFEKDHETLIDLSDAKGINVASISKKILRGDNYFDITLSNRFEKGKIYTLTITGIAGKTMALLFSIK